MSPLEAISAFSHRVVPAVLLAAAATLRGSAIGDPATACAAPREWDIGAYDQCVKSGLGKGYNDVEWEEHEHQCCLDSGGVWNLEQGKCQAPPADAESQPGVAPTPGVASQTEEPAPPPVTRVPLGDITATFAPAPAG